MAAESVIIRQNSRLETEIQFADPETGTLHTVGPVQELTPYGMMLAGLGACTGIVVHTYAHHHDIDLDHVEIRLRYDRVFRDDCDDCENIDRYDEQIDEAIAFQGNLSEEERQRLFKIAHHCPIYKMYRQGIEVNSLLVTADSQFPQQSNGG